jgi:hypothetical protein
MGTRHAALAIVLILLGTLAFSQQKPAPQRGIPQRVLQDAVLGFYVTEFQKQAEVSSEVFGKILPFLQQFVQDRFQISQRRTRALNQLRQAIQRGDSEEDLKRLVHDFDSADADFQSNQEKFLSNVDPLLDARQQAKLRIFQVMADNRMRQILTNVQNANRGQ